MAFLDSNSDAGNQGLYAAGLMAGTVGAVWWFNRNGEPPEREPRASRAVQAARIREEQALRAEVSSMASGAVKNSAPTKVEKSVIRALARRLR